LKNEIIWYVFLKNLQILVGSDKDSIHFAVVGWSQMDYVRDKTSRMIGLKTHQRGTHTLLSVAVFERDMSPCDGNLFHAITPLMTS